MKEVKRKRLETVCIVIFNLLLAAVMVVIIAQYVFDYQNKLYERNLNDIGHINQAAANLSAGFFSNQEDSLRSITRYVYRRSPDTEELMKYLDDINARSNVSYQLIDSDCKSYAIADSCHGEAVAVDYSHIDYANIKRVFASAADNDGKISFASEFTDQFTGMRSFARYTYIPVSENGNSHFYTLMEVSRSSEFIDMINIDNGYNKLSTVLINSDGSYLLRHSDFKSDNLFDYIYIYNNLTLDEKNALRESVNINSSGFFRYLNVKSEDCLFVYTRVPETDWFSVSCVPVSSFHDYSYGMQMTLIIVGMLAVLTFIDFIWLWELNRRLKSSAAEANLANEAKTDFLSRMSHDIRTPINVITGMTELALQEKNPSETDDYLKNIQSSGKFLLGLVNDILDMNKVESGKMELHPQPYLYSDFKAYISAVVVPLCTAKNIEFTMTGNADSLVLVVDSLRMNQIFFNLLSNSVKFTKNGGHISLSAVVGEAVPDGKTPIDFEVRDDGIGMSDEFQKNMFSAFTQEHRAHSQDMNGTGLGLAIVKSIVDLMGGTVSVKSRVDEGTSFFIRLYVKVSAAELKSKSESGDESILSGKTVLLCEDHPLNAQIITRLLGKKGVAVDVAENGKLGTEMFLDSADGHYDAVLMDIRMPVMDGLEASKIIRSFKAVRKDAERIPIIALTANAYDSDVKNCLSAGMNSHLAKPIEPELLFSTLNLFISDYREK